MIPKARLITLFIFRLASHENEAVAGVAAQWANSDLNAAIAWVQQLPEGQARQNAFNNLTWQWVQADPAAAASAAAKMQPARRKTISSPTSPASGPGRIPRRRWRGLRVLPQGQARTGALQNLVSGWAATDPKAAADYALAFPPGQTRNQSINNIVSQWAGSDPMAAADYVKQLPEGQIQRDALRSLSYQLAESDPKAAAGLADSLPAGRSRNEFLNQVGLHLGAQQPDRGS